MSVNPIPDGYHSVSAYMIIKDAKSAISFYQKAFNAKAKGQLTTPDGAIMHGEMIIGNSHIMYGEENAEMDMLSPQTLNGCSVSLCIYVEDADALFNQAIEAGATAVKPMEDQFWGDRAGTVQDPYGYSWTLMSKIEDVEWDEVQNRLTEMMS